MTTERMVFESMSDIPGWLAGRPQVTTGNSSTNKCPSRDRDLNTDLEQALDIARRGGDWEEGGKLIKETTLVMGNLSRVESIPTRDIDVAGYELDLDSYLAGDPCHMWNDYEDEVNRKPIITIGVGVRSPVTFTSTHKVNYGAAILSVIDELENKGARVELWAVYANQSWNGDRTDFRVLIKAADEHWSPNKAAFALAHPAYHRRIMFRMAESFVSLSRFTGDGYGSGYDLVDDFDVWVPALTAGDENWAGSKLKSLDHATTLVQNQLIQQQEQAA